MPQTSVPIAHLPLTCLSNVEHTDTQTDVVKDPIRVLFVEDTDDSLLSWLRKASWLQSNRVLQHYKLNKFTE